jgi:putative polyketide hydroxylase
MTSETLETSVLIAGGGPVGLAASIALSCHGVRSLLVERHPDTTRHPKASVVNARTMELFRQWGIETVVRDGGVPLERMANVFWMTAITGFEIGRLTLGDEATSAAYLHEQGPAPVAICAQDVVEPALLDRARRSSFAELRYGTELESCAQDAEGVTATIHDRTSGARQAVRARYLVAADGHASATRERLGIAMEGPAPLGHLVNVHFVADLTPWIADRAGILYWIINPEVVGVFIALNGRDRWLFNLPYDPARESAADYPPERCVALLRRATGIPALAPVVQSVTTWTMRREVAARYREGRVFLAGDAAHQFPPTGGFGMNCGIQDAHNLAWKLAAVLQGWADPALLDTYESERRPVARECTEQSSKNAQTVVADMRPVAVIEDAGPEGEAFRSMIASGIPAQREHFDSQGLALGFHYDSAAVVADGTPPPLVENPIRDYVPVARPGHRAPHAWIEVGGRRVSTLDLFDGRFVLFTTRAGAPWCDAARAIAERDALPLVAYALACDPPGDDWRARYDIEPDGAVLVRPDGHVGWRARSAAAEPQAILDAVLRIILGRSPIVDHDARRAPAHA